jgi:hypothetical protein
MMLKLSMCVAAQAEIKEINFEEEALANLPRRCCTLEEVKRRPEIVLWYLGNMLSYLGFFMPFLNLVSTCMAVTELMWGLFATSDIFL